MTQQLSGKTKEDIIEEKKKEFAKKLLWGSLSIVGIIILFVAAIMLCSGVRDSTKKKETEKIIINALKMKLGNPATLKILDISNPDSVFYNRICPEKELMEVSEKFLSLSINMMQASREVAEETTNPALLRHMYRFSETSNTINSLNEMLEKPAGKHSGWRYKVKYQTIDGTDTPYNAETWFIFDKRKKHIINSFDFCLL